MKKQVNNGRKNGQNNGQNNYIDSKAVKKAKKAQKAQKAQKALVDCPKVLEAWLPRPSIFTNVNVWERPDGKNPDELFKPVQIGPFAPGWTKINPFTLKPN